MTGRRVLAVGAAGAGRRPVSDCQPRQAGEDRAEVGGDQVERLRHLQDEGGVEDVLGRRAAMEIGSELRRQLCLDRLDEGDRRHTGGLGRATEAGEVEVVGADLLDRGGEAVAAQPYFASARASAASVRSIAASRARSANTARIASVAKSGPVSAESRAEKVMAVTSPESSSNGSPT